MLNPIHSGNVGTLIELGHRLHEQACRLHRVSRRAIHSKDDPIHKEDLEEVRLDTENLFTGAYDLWEEPSDG